MDNITSQNDVAAAALMPLPLSQWAIVKLVSSEAGQGIPMRTSGAAAIDPTVLPGQMESGEGAFGPIRRFAKTSRISALSAVFLVILVLIAIFAGQVAPYHPLEADFKALRQPPSVRALAWHG